MEKNMKNLSVSKGCAVAKYKITVKRAQETV